MSLVEWTTGPDHMIAVLQRGRDGDGLAKGADRLGDLAARQWKITHKWNNRTTDLEGSIGHVEQVGAAFIIITVYATMYYGIYVETRWGGRYASLMAALYAATPNIQREAAAMYLAGFR